MASISGLLERPLKLLNLVGMIPYDSSGFFKKVKQLIFLVVTISLTIDGILIVLFNWRGFDSMAEITIYISFVHISLKFSSMVRKNHAYVAIFHMLNKFTRWENLSGSIKKDIDETISIILKAAKLFFFSAVVVVLGFCCAPLSIASDDKRITPLDTYFARFFDDTKVYATVYVLQVVELWIEMLAVVGFDLLFIFIMTCTSLEINILKNRIKHIVINADVKEDDNKEIYNIVSQHNMILRMINQLDVAYSDAILFQFLTSTMFLATSLFNVMDKGFPPPMSIFLQYGTHLIAAMLQLLMYCTLGQIIINESESIGDWMFNINWWVKPQPKLRRACLFVIQRSHKLDCLTAAGMFKLNYESYTKVLKFGLSLFSLTQAVKSRVKTIAGESE